MVNIEVMEEEQNSQITKITKHFSQMSPQRLLLVVIGTSVLLGVITGYILSTKGSTVTPIGSIGAPTAPQLDTKTFRDFAEGTIKVKPQPSDPGEYTEGTHTLQREGAVPVALTSSVVDLSKYEGKKVKIYGETQKALKEGWLMDVGKVEEVK